MNDPRTISFSITGRAVPWKAPTVVARRGGGRPIGIKPKVVHEWQAYVRMAAAEAAEKAGGLLVGAIKADVTVRMAIPAGWPTWRRHAARVGYLRPTKRPDSTNLLKAIEDAMEGICYANDCQIVSTHMSRWYADDGTQETVSIMLTEIGLGHNCERAEYLELMARSGR